MVRQTLFHGIWCDFIYTLHGIGRHLMMMLKKINMLINTCSHVAATFKSREDHRKQLELEEARKAGLATAEVDEDGKEINPHIPQYMSSAPWYLNAEKPSLKHQRKWKSDPNYTKSWYDRGAKIFVSDKDRKGACENTYGVDETKVDESKQVDFAKVEKRVRTTETCVSGRTLQKYLLNLDVNSAYYDPKTRSMREDPLPDTDPNEKFHGFKHLNLLAWEAFEKGQDIPMQPAPSQAELLYKNFTIIKEKLKSQTKNAIMEKYENAAAQEELPRELLLGQTEKQVEYDRAGKIIKDLCLGSWWKDHQWDYKCCKQTIHNSYCTGAAGIEAAEAVSDLMKANIDRKEASEGKSPHLLGTPNPAEENRLATWGTDVPNDLVTPEEMEAYRLKKIHHDDPMKAFLH
ncbi:hypothetical protein VNO78_20158 [Psophocarpus tetragonolobus]|uniref:Pre-mRNA-splicing factor SLU7 n=1 Tax=Psophocarpus tetragonolobus TaxID=3891 RepID=A0AAN9SE26_PSOTE